MEKFAKRLGCCDFYKPAVLGANGVQMHPNDFAVTFINRPCGVQMHPKYFSKNFVNAINFLNFFYL